MSNKEIVIVHKTCVADFPPLYAFLKYLEKRHYKITLIVGFEHSDLEDELKKICDKYHNLNVTPQRNKILYWYNVRKTFWKCILENNYQNQLLWIPSADTTIALGSKLLKYKFVLNLYELFDYQFMYLKLLRKFAKKTQLLICSDINRSNILRVWWKLEQTPEVILNKPHTLITGNKLPLSDDLAEIIKSNNSDKILIYQGLIAEERGLYNVCKVINQLSGYKLLIMGKKNQYSEYLLKSFPNIIHIPFVAPPYHLHITSHAYIGILSYDHSSLNNIFCAPNKLWEFSNFGLPMLGNNIPGLISTIEASKMGKCVDFQNEDEVRNAIAEIDINYQYYSRNSSKFYENYDYDVQLDIIMEKAYKNI